MDIRQRLIELQEQHGWSDYKIAKEAGLSPNTVSNIYRRGNTPSMVTLEALCKAFGISVSVEIHFSHTHHSTEKSRAAFVNQKVFRTCRLLHGIVYGYKKEMKNIIEELWNDETNPQDTLVDNNLHYKELQHLQSRMA